MALTWFLSLNSLSFRGYGTFAWWMFVNTFHFPLFILFYTYWICRFWESITIFTIQNSLGQIFISLFPSCFALCQIIPRWTPLRAPVTWPPSPLPWRPLGFFFGCKKRGTLATNITWKDARGSKKTAASVLQSPMFQLQTTSTWIFSWYMLRQRILLRAVR